MEVYEFNKARKFYNYLCEELHFAVLYHDVAKCSRILLDLGLFIPNNIFNDLVEYGAPQEIIKKVFDHKQKNDAFINDICSSMTEDKLSLSDLKYYIMINYGNLKMYDMVNAQMLLRGSYGELDQETLQNQYDKQSIRNYYKPLHLFVDEMMFLASYCGKYSIICYLLKEFDNHGIHFKFDPENNICHKNIQNILDKGMAGDLLNDDHAGNIGPNDNSISV